jgi:hypothetical protein
MKYMRTSVWERILGEAVVEVTIGYARESRMVTWTANVDELEAHGEKCLLVAMEMRRRQAAGVK